MGQPILVFSEVVDSKQSNSQAQLGEKIHKPRYAATLLHFASDLHPEAARLCG
jgi:hypothetical protein